jgi:hypothetical protein
VSGQFTIAAAKVTVTSPNTAVIWLLGSVQPITWTHNVGATASFKIEISRDAGTTWTLLTAAAPATGASSGSYDWTVVAPKTEKGRVRVTWNGGTANDKSDANFKVR